MKIYLLLFTAVLLFGCTQISDIGDASATDLTRTGSDSIIGDSDTTSGDSDSGTQIEDYPTVNEVLGQNLTGYYREIYKYEQTCNEGDCPNNSLAGPKGFSECFFCNKTQVKEGTISSNIATTNNYLSIAGCAERDAFGYPAELKIISKTTNTIIAEGSGSGTHSQEGNCANYSYRYTTKERWTFTLNKLGGNVTINTTSSNNATVLSAPGWSNPSGFNAPYSTNSLTVECQSNEGFGVRPFVEVVKINGKNATAFVNFEFEPRTYGANPLTVRFSSFWNANYTLVGGCHVTAAEISKVYDTKEFYVIVSDAPQGNIPSEYLEQ